MTKEKSPERAVSEGRFAILYFAWGEEFLQEVEHSIQNSPLLVKYDILLLTDRQTDLNRYEHLFSQVIIGDFQMSGLLRKSELIHYLPSGYDAFLFLDSDTIVLEEISFGFEMSLKHGIAMAPCHHYGLENFWGFREVMKAAGQPQRGQLQYNTGVLFFRNSPDVLTVLKRWNELVLKYKHIHNNDQPFFTLAMERLGYNPYTLPITYNYRGSGDVILGKVRIWHSHYKRPGNVNKKPDRWPPRRAYHSTLIYFDLNRIRYWPGFLLQRIRRALRRKSL